MRCMEIIEPQFQLSPAVVSSLLGLDFTTGHTGPATPDGHWFETIANGAIKPEGCPWMVLSPGDPGQCLAATLSAIKTLAGDAGTLHWREPITVEKEIIEGRALYCAWCRIAFEKKELKRG